MAVWARKDLHFGDVFFMSSRKMSSTSTPHISQLTQIEHRFEQLKEFSFGDMIEGYVCFCPGPTLRFKYKHVRTGTFKNCSTSEVSSRKYLFDHGMYERRNGKLQENSAASQVIFIYIHFQFGACSQHTHQLQVSTGFPHAQRDLTVEAQRTFKTSCL